MSALHRLRLNRSLSSNSSSRRAGHQVAVQSQMLCKPRNNRMMMKRRMRMVAKRFPELTTLPSMPDYRYQVRSKNSSNISSDISHKRLIWTPSSSPSFQNIFHQLERSMLSLRCRNRTELKKILVSQSWMNLLSILKTKLLSNYDIFRSAMSYVLHL